MKKCNYASINSIETAGMVDGPGIRTVIFFNGCMLRCKYCHNPETWEIKDKNMTVDILFDKILRNKVYFKNGGGVTFSGGEPLLHVNFIVELSKQLKKENIHLVLDTAGVGIGDYDKLLSLMDLIIFDVKDVRLDFYKSLTGYPITKSDLFIENMNKSNKKVWIRQVIIPGYNDNKDYLKLFKKYIQKIKNIEKIEFLPYHTNAKGKYKSLNIDYEYQHLEDVSDKKIQEIYTIYNSL